MKIFTKKIRGFFIILGFCLCFILGIVAINMSENRLSKAEILKLREQYPICGVDVPPLMSMAPDSPHQFESVLERTESFIYGEIMGECNYYNQFISTGYEELDNKLEANGIDNIYQFYEYTLFVMEDTSGTYSEGDIITVTDNTAFMSYNPSLSNGMKIILPIYERNDENHPDRKGFAAVGVYYVTEDGYAISAFNEETRSNYNLSGLKVEDTMDTLSELKEKKARTR